MSGFNLVRTVDNTIIGKLPVPTKPNSDLRILRFVEPSQAWPSGKLILQNVKEMRLYNAAPPAVGYSLVPRG